jgi:signal transduction histidine kinase
MGAQRQPDPDAAELADQISHELGTALALIAGYAESLREALGAPAPGTEIAVSLEGIERGVARLRGVSDRLADWGRAHREPASAGGDGPDE